MSSAASLTDLQATPTEELIPDLMESMLHNAHTAGNDPDFDQKVESAYEKLMGVSYYPSTPSTMYVRGFPGHGKTTIYKVAAKKVADLLGLNYVQNPSDTYIPSKEDFLFISHESAGEQSAISFGGMPAKKQYEENGETVEYMTALLNKRFVGLQHARTGVLLFDDAANANPMIQNAIMAIAEERRYKGADYSNATIGLTGNLGKDDGTNIANTSSAMATRVRVVITEDTVDQWINRTLDETRNHPVSDAGMCGFFDRNRDLFHKPTGAKHGVPYPTPRSNSKATAAMQDILRVYVERRKKDPFVSFPFERVERKMSGYLGAEAGHKVSAYMHQMMTNAEPIASAYMKQGELNESLKAQLESAYGDGKSAEEKDFAYQYMEALSDHATNAIIANFDDPAKLETVMDNFGKALFEPDMEEGASAYCSSMLARKLVIRSQEDPRIGQMVEGNPQLHMDFLYSLLDSMVKQPNANQSVGVDEKGEHITKLNGAFIQPITTNDQNIQPDSIVSPTM